MFLLINFWKCFLEISKLFSLGDFPGGASTREPVCQFRRCKRLGSVPGLGRSLGGGHGNPLQYSSLDNPMDRGACQAMVHRVTKSWTWLKPPEMHAPKEILQNILTTHCTLWFRKQDQEIQWPAQNCKANTDCRFPHFQPRCSFYYKRIPLKVTF